MKVPKSMKGLRKITLEGFINMLSKYSVDELKLAGKKVDDELDKRGQGK